MRIGLTTPVLCSFAVLLSACAVPGDGAGTLGPEVDAGDGLPWVDGGGPSVDGATAPGASDATPEDGELSTTSGKRVAVRAGETTHAELVKTLSVARNEAGADRRVVMRLAPSDLPGLAAHDRLITPAEVEVTVRCDIGQSAPGCNYNPSIAAQLILTGESNDKEAGGPESKALSEVMTTSCTHAEHHCMFVFRPAAARLDLEGAANLNCIAHQSCSVNLVMWAWDLSARAGGIDKVLVGANEMNYLDNGVVEGDKGRLMAIRERNLAAGDRHLREASGSRTLTMPTNADPVVIYSLALKAGDGELVRGEQFVVEAKVVTEVSSRARFSTQLIVAKRPDATGGGLAAIAPHAIGEHNGKNCTPGTSPCTTRKVAVFRVDGDISGRVYVNLIAKSEVPGGGSARVTVDQGKGWLRATRYAAALH